MTKTFNIGKGISIEVDVAAIMAHQNVVDGLVDFAIRQRLSNAHASITAEVEPDDAKRTDQSRAAAEKLLASMLAGEYTIQERGSRGDPVQTELLRMADSDLRKAMKASGIKVADLEKGVFGKALAAHAKANEAKWRKAAEKAVAAKKEVVGEEVDLSSLGLVAKETAAG